MRSWSAPGPTGWPPPSPWPGPGCSVVVLEAEDTAGGGCRSEELTLPGFVHDVCSRHPSPGGVVARLRRPAPRRPRPGVGPSRGAGRPSRSPTGGRRCWSGRSTPRPTASAPTTAGPGGGWSAPSSSTGTTSPPRSSGPMLRVPRHPVTLTRFGLQALWPATALARPGLRGRGGPGPVRGPGRPRHPRPRRAPHLVVRAHVRRLRPRRGLAGGQGRVAAAHRRPRLLPALAGRRGR